MATCSTHLCVVEVDISPQGELSSLRVYMRALVAILVVSSKWSVNLLEKNQIKAVSTKKKYIYIIYINLFVNRHHHSMTDPAESVTSLA